MKAYKFILPTVTAAAIGFSTTTLADNDNSAINDAWLDGKLDTVILLNDNLSTLDVDTDVTNNVAVISGEVDSPSKKMLLSEVAMGVEGISEVDNRVQVVAPEKPLNEKIMTGVTDASISTAIETKLLLNTSIDSFDIDVETNNKEVTLTGTVESMVEKDLVEQISMKTFDVKSVNNQLTVDNSKS